MVKPQVIILIIRGHISHEKINDAIEAAHGIRGSLSRLNGENENYLIITDGQLTGILDFGGTLYSPLICPPACHGSGSKSRAILSVD